MGRYFAGIIAEKGAIGWSKYRKNLCNWSITEVSMVTGFVRRQMRQSQQELIA